MGVTHPTSNFHGYCHVLQSRRLRRTAGGPFAPQPAGLARQLARGHQGFLAARPGQLPQGRRRHSRPRPRRFAGGNLDRGSTASRQGSRRGCGGRSGHRRADAGLENFRRGHRTVAGHGAHRGEPAGRCRAVPEVSAIHQHPHRPGATRRATDAGQAGSAVPEPDPGWPAALGAVGRARAPHQLRRTDQVFQPGDQGIPGHAPEGAQGHAAGGRAAAHQHVFARALGAGFLHAPDFRRFRKPRRLSTLHRGLPDPRAGRLRRFRAPLTPSPSPGGRGE
jgi:hypothetical protein